MLLTGSGVCSECYRKLYSTEEPRREETQEASGTEQSKLGKRHKMKRGTRCGARWGGAGVELGFHPVSQWFPLTDVKKEGLPKVRDEQALLDMREHEKHSSSGSVRQM